MRAIAVGFLLGWMIGGIPDRLRRWRLAALLAGCVLCLVLGLADVRAP